jgi:hypothetical protein
MSTPRLQALATESISPRSDEWHGRHGTYEVGSKRPRAERGSPQGVAGHAMALRRWAIRCGRAAKAIAGQRRGSRRQRGRCHRDAAIAVQTPHRRAARLGSRCPPEPAVVLRSDSAALHSARMRVNKPDDSPREGERALKAPSSIVGSRDM